jgi:pyrimidine-specific ribonucleoside hydrolase
MKKPVILDCDPGVDDTLAIMLALSSDKLDVRAITTVAGNQTIEKITQNALDIVDYIGCDCKVAKGAARPIACELCTAEDVHGETGLGNLKLPRSNKLSYYRNAYETIYEETMASEEKIRIIALGPLTNIAITLITYPDIKDKIEGITLMGGAWKGGNVTPVAEYNIFTDPEAAKIVFESGLPITMMGLDVTHKAYVLEEEIDELTKLNSKVSIIVKDLLYSVHTINKHHGIDGAVMHDPLAVASVINEELVATKLCHVDIETKGEFTRGCTVVDINNIKKKTLNARVGLEVERNKFLKMLSKMIDNLDKHQ